MSARLGAHASRAGLDLAYLGIGLATSVIAFVVWVTAVTVTLSLLVFVVGLPLFLLSAIAFRWTAELDRRNGALIGGEPLHGRYREHDGEGFFARLGSTAGDGQTWKDLSWLVVHSVLGFAFGVAALSAVGATIGTFFMPLWFWAVPDGVDWIGWHIDTVPLAFLATVASIPLAALTVLMLRGMAIVESWLAAALLGGGEQPAPAPAVTLPREPGPEPSEREPASNAGLIVQLVVSGLLALLVTAIWLATGADNYFWPAWVWLGLLIPLSLHFGIREALRLVPGQGGLAIQAVVSLVIVGICLVIWGLTGFGRFWPIWPILGLATLFVIHLGLRIAWQRAFPDKRERELSERVETLTKTRRGALDVQSAELRRIERDLHDGAQARLVALSMQLGRAEQDLADKPEAAELVRAARSEASAAIAELRDLARGIAPPVLADRGLPAAVEALGRRSPIQVTIDASAMEGRPPAVIETAAYFVVAEALTNVAKHAPEAAATVRISGGDEVLRVSVADDGPGGADTAGGSGLEGLRARVAALDGELSVSSAPGRGTTIEAVLPCGS